MMDRHDWDLFFSNPRDDTVVPKNDLTDGFKPRFWDYPSRTWMLSQAVCGAEGAISKHRRDVGCVASNKEADRFKVIESL